jgi:hypothetical protein
MALIIAVGVFIVSVLAAALSSILADDIRAWIPSIVRSITKRAVAWLPENQRARLDEEWQSHVNEVPGTIGKLLEAAGFLLAAHNLSKGKAKNLPTQEEAEQIKKKQESLPLIDWMNHDDSANYLAVSAIRDREAAQMRVAAMRVVS